MKNKHGCQMKNTWDIVQIIDVHIQGIYAQMCIKFEVANTNISGPFEINAIKRINMATK